MLIRGRLILVWELRIYGQSLYISFNFVVNLKLLYKLRSIFFKSFQIKFFIKIKHEDYTSFQKQVFKNQQND